MNQLNHIAFIMDGNGRWGKKRGKGRNYGHLKGVETVKKIVQASIEFQIPIITFYVFSSENLVFNKSLPKSFIKRLVGVITKK